MTQKHIRKPYTKKDFSWVSYTARDINRVVEQYIKNVHEVYEGIKNIPKEKQTFENTVLAYSGIHEKFNGEDSPLSLLLYLSTKKTVRDACHAGFEKISKCFLQYAYDKELHQAFLLYSKNNAKKDNLRPEDVKLLKDTLRSYRKSGIALPEKTQKLLTKKIEKLQKISREFARTIDEYHDEIWVSEKDLIGLPVGYKESLVKKNGKYQVTLAYPHVGPFMQYSENVAQRKELLKKIKSLGGRKNITRLSQMVSLRSEVADILGYKNFADFVIEDEMAKKSSKVHSFLISLQKDLRPIFKKEQKELEKYKQKTTGKKGIVEYYESAYLARKYKEEKFTFDINKLREYFPLPHVQKEMFSIFGKLFDVIFTKSSLPVWHKDVEIYEVKEGKGALLGYVGFDLFPRKGKYSHMACVPVLVGHEKKWKKTEYATPFSCIMGNFPAPSKKVPSLLSLREAETLFHEFGHAMHGVLGNAALAEQSGTNTTTDFVEIPSQLFEEWFWDIECLSKLASHYKTGESLPDDTKKSLLESRYFFEASATYDQVGKALYDLELYTSPSKKLPHIVWQEKRKKAGYKSFTPGSLFPASWGHMAGYESKYYSYLWSLVYAKDIFSIFKKEGVLNKKTGKRLREELLASGSSREEMKSLKAFLGRAPRKDAFIKSLKG